MTLASDFGFGPNQSPAANSAAFNAMLAAASTSEASFDLGAGVCLIDAPIAATFPNRLTLYGNGVVLRWTCPNGGLSLTYADMNKPPEIRGRVAFETTAVGGGTAVTVKGPVYPSVTKRGPVIEATVRGDNPAVSYWNGGIHLVNCWHPYLISPDIKGLDQALNPFAMSIGIEAECCQALRIDNVNMWHMERAYKTTGTMHGEGLQISGGEIVGVTYGIDHEATGLVPGTSIRDLHINAYVRCMVLKNIAQFSVHDCLLYKTHISVSEWQGIELSGCYDCDIHDLYGGTPGVVGTSGGNFVTLVQSNYNRIHDIHGSNWVNPGAMVILAAGSDYNRIHDITAAPTGTPLTGVALIGAGGNNSVKS